LAVKLKLENLFSARGFKPSESQRAAILHVDGPLFLPAGPGSGKTRVLLWRALNLIVFHEIAPDQIYLSTFTEKAAFQLKEGLRSLLADVTNKTGVNFDISQMYVGTVHSLCRKLILDRRFSPNHQRTIAPALLDELDQYFFLFKKENFLPMLAAAGFSEDGYKEINMFFEGADSESRHRAVTSCISFFNRLSEENVDPVDLRTRTTDPALQKIIDLYRVYHQTLCQDHNPHLTDFALLQQEAFKAISANPKVSTVFKHVIIDEYQDTNTIQEKIFFKLAEGSKNLCVVGDDDQALYRFRGATVENFVQFPDRCKQYLNLTPKTIVLSTNYRSRSKLLILQRVHQSLRLVRSEASRQVLPR